MSRSAFLLVLFAAVALAAAPARAQDAGKPPPVPPTTAPSPTPKASAGDTPAPAVVGCVKRDARPRPSSATDATAAAPVTWSEFDVEGELRDPPATVRALFLPVMSRHPALTDDARAEVACIASRYGYAVVRIEPRETAKGTHAVIQLAALPMVRKVNVHIKQSLFAALLDDQVRRRLRIRPGAYLPWSPAERTAELDDERDHIADYLHLEEGYFDATVEHAEEPRGDGIEITLNIVLGSKYKTGTVTVENADQLARVIDPREIVAQFHHESCLLFICWFGESRFTRANHLDDLRKVVARLQKLNFPAARVHTSFEQDPRASFNRRTHGVDFTVSVDLRRGLDLQFEGYNRDSISQDQLREHVTFDTAASSDDVEAAASARALTLYLQSRGWFEAHVTFNRERKQTVDQSTTFDRITFTIDAGKQRPVRSISFRGNQAFSSETLDDELGTTETKLSTSLFGGNTNATIEQLDGDVDRITAFYRRAGYRDVRVHAEVASDPIALGSAALTAALTATDRGNGLHVRYAIDEGAPTFLTGVELVTKRASEPLDREVCKQALADLAELYGVKSIETPLPGDRCAAKLTDVKLREEEAAATRDALKDRLYNHGRPRAEVGYELVVTGDHQVTARYTLASLQRLQFGKVVVRGNFKTRTSIIATELGIRQGAPLTGDALADGARRLRNTALFDAVSVSLPDLDTITAGEVNAVVDVVERYDYRARVDAEVGYSSYNGAFLKLIPSFKNLFGVGVSLDTAGTIGFDLVRYLGTSETRLRQLSAEATLRFPQWLSRRFSPVEFQTELTAFHRRQDDPRFGVVTTDGVTVTLSRTWERKRIGTRPARAITTGLHYDFRLRERPIDVLRPAGADDDQSQVPVSTRTGSVGLAFEWEQRVNRDGVLSPLGPEAGFRFEAQVALASLYLGGQDTFLKLSTAGSRYWPIGKRLTVRADLRYDQGVPLGGAVLLPEVERFFAGGDSTVRGYDDERLHTEIVQVGVPPLANVQQIRVLPAGGNIRVMSSLDAQVRIWSLFATALFADAGLITNQWGTVTTNDIRPSVGMALFRLVTPFGAVSIERAIPLRPQLGDDPRGRWHFSLAARTQF